jgi:hypothetical protein
VDARDKRGHDDGEAGARAKVAVLRVMRPSRRLGGLRQTRQAAQDRGRAFEPLLGRRPVLEEYDLLVGPHARLRSLLADEGDEPIRVGEAVIAEGDHRALGSGLDPLHIGAPA